MFSFRRRQILLQLTQMFLLLAFIAKFGIVRHFLGTFTVAAQHPSCSLVTSHALFKSEHCCFNQKNPCRDDEFCLGVAIASNEDTELECCEAYESCISTHDLFHTLNIFKGLTVGDLVVSTLLILLTIFKMFMIWGNNNNNNNNFYLTKGCAISCIVLEFIDLILEVVIVAVALTVGSRDFVAELRSAGCFNGKEEDATIGGLSSLFERYYIIAILEAFADILAIVLHFLELREIGQEDDREKCLAIFAGIADVLEFVLAILNLTLILRIIGNSTALHSTMNFSPSTESSGACVYNCCIPKVLMALPTPPPTQTPSAAYSPFPTTVEPSGLPSFAPITTVTNQEMTPATTTAQPVPGTTSEPPTLDLTEGQLVTTTVVEAAIYTEIVRPAGEQVGDRFGDFVEVSRDGTTIASGAEVGNYVQVYRNEGMQGWKKIGQTIYGSGGGDQFGKGLDLNEDGSVLVVGAWHNDDEANNAGHVKVFRLEGDEWNKVGQTLVGRAENDHFGWYVSLSDDGNTMAASAFSGNANGNKEAGYVRVFTLGENDSWIQLGDDLIGEKKFEQFGRAMAMSGDGRRLAVGTSRGNKKKGVVRVFDYSGSGWSQVGQDLTGSLTGDWFGSGVALNLQGDIVAVGADGFDNMSGLVRVYRLEGCCTWKQYGQDILGEEYQGRFGMHQVALSNDGNYLVAGASEVNDFVGKGYMYFFSGNEWKKVVEISGDARSDELGESVSLSGDGAVAVFGAREYNSTRSGYFKVYDARQ